jgi:hypothetical protein
VRKASLWLQKHTAEKSGKATPMCITTGRLLKDRDENMTPKANSRQAHVNPAKSSANWLQTGTPGLVGCVGAHLPANSAASLTTTSSRNTSHSFQTPPQAHVATRKS